ncbi:major facilitator family transporter [Stigmatella aurantiaca DW4/3-1]|uniref:Major facilitator family transporter n=1 Tax=Stigmatella aurantiaca (strain DW4/3-1) TaxID=378806 RepID=Q08ZR4_STIAD|nr:major facilitator family transporter [Stigmatella aurantiaca DW4/3-1]
MLQDAPASLPCPPNMKFLRDLRSVLNLTVLVAGLGYFVDLFDITLFGVVRVASLKDIGITDPAEILEKGLLIYNCQMIGMMVGGLVWGILADRRGRLSVMFGSILLYSFANIGNAFAWDATSYAVFRFLGGLGLAGELGAAITLVAESLPKDKRGLGTTVVATLGMLGIVAAALIGQRLHWKTAYLTGGVMGLALLFARFKISESELFAKKTDPSRANPLLLLQGGRFLKYVCCILIGVPIYFTTGILFTFAPELTAGLNVQGTVTAGNAILYGSFGLTLGDLLSGLFSQWLKSRRRAVALNLVLGFGLMLVYGLASGLTSTTIYLLSFLIGITVGYWGGAGDPWRPSSSAPTSAPRWPRRCPTSCAARRRWRPAGSRCSRGRCPWPTRRSWWAASASASRCWRSRASRRRSTGTSITRRAPSPNERAQGAAGKPQTRLSANTSTSTPSEACTSGALSGRRKPTASSRDSSSPSTRALRTG